MDSISQEKYSNEDPYMGPDRRQIDCPNYQGLERRAEEIQKMDAITRLAIAVEHVVKDTRDNKKTLELMQKDFVDIRMDVQKSTIIYGEFIKGYEKKILLCDELHKDHESRLRDCPAAKRVDDLEKSDRDQDKRIYKIIGAMAVVFPAATLLIQWIIKKMAP